MIYDDDLKRKVVEFVKGGGTYYSASQKFGVPVSTIAFWCNSEGVSSEYSKVHRRATDDDIIKLVSRKKVMTEREIEKYFGYSRNSLRTRLRKMVHNGKLCYISLTSSRKNLLKKYVGSNLYYCDYDDLKSWILSKLPKGLPPALKRVVTSKLHDVGIDLFEPKKVKSIVFDENEYNRLSEEAKRYGMGVKEYVLFLMKNAEEKNYGR